MKPRLRFGISTTVLREHPISYALTCIADVGFDSAEIWQWHLEKTGEDPRSIFRQATDLGLDLTFHASGDALNPASGNPNVRQRSQTWLEASLNMGAALGARAVAVHPGQKDSSEDSPEEVWKRLVPWVVRLDEIAAELDLRVGLELMEKLPLEVFMLPEDAARLMPLSHEHVGLTVDIAHMNTHGDPLKFLRGLDPNWIYHVHLSDNAPHRVHLPLGDGDMELGVVLQAVEKVYQGIVSIEGSMPGQGEHLLQRNMDYLRKLGF